MAATKDAIAVVTRIAAARVACADGTFAAVLNENELRVLDVAEALRTHPSTIYRWMNGAARPTRQQALRLADLLDALPGESQAPRRR